MVLQENDLQQGAVVLLPPKSRLLFHHDHVLLLLYHSNFAQDYKIFKRYIIDVISLMMVNDMKHLQNQQVPFLTSHL